jgi:hypothetical protein
MEWFRFYKSALRDPKLKRLCRQMHCSTAECLGIWAAILCMASDSPKRGELLLSIDQPVEPDDLNDAIEITNAAEWMNAMKSLSMLSFEHGIWRITNWEKRQFESDSSTPRTRNYRQRKAETPIIPTSGSHKSVMGTSQERHSDGPDTDTDTDTDTEKNHAAPQKKIAAPAPEIPAKKSKPSKPEKPPIPEAVKIYHEMTNLYPPKPLFEKIDQTVGHDPPKLEFWKQVILEWLGLGFKKNNCSGMLQCFSENRLPGDDRSKNNGNRRGQQDNGSGRLREAFEGHKVVTEADRTGIYADSLADE